MLHLARASLVVMGGYHTCQLSDLKILTLDLDYAATKTMFAPKTRPHLQFAVGVVSSLVRLVLVGRVGRQAPA